MSMERCISVPHRVRPNRSYRLGKATIGTFVAAFALLLSSDRAVAQKTDVVVLRNGDAVTGEIKELKRGKIRFSTDAMGTVYVEWPKIKTLTTDKTFDIELTDGARIFGSMRAAEDPNQVELIAEEDTLVVATQSIIGMLQVGESFWKRFDGSADLGFDFTQQNAKADLRLSSQVKYQTGLNRFVFNFASSFSRQDSVEDISNLNTDLIYLREFASRWFYSGVLSVEQNSQLSLDIRGSFSALAGRFVVQSNQVLLGISAGLGYSRERFEDQSGSDTFQGLLATQFDFFNWGGLDTDLSSRLEVIPVINQGGRWRIAFTTDFKREILGDFFIKVGIREYFDSQPPTEDTNTNDITLNTSLGYSF